MKMNKVIKCESLAVATMCLEKTIEKGIRNLGSLLEEGVTLETLESMMQDYTSLVSILKECSENGCDKFSILPVKDIEVIDCGTKQ